MTRVHKSLINGRIAALPWNREVIMGEAALAKISVLPCGIGKFLT